MGVGREGGRWLLGEGKKRRPMMSFVRITNKSILNVFIMCLSSHPLPLTLSEASTLLLFRGGFLSAFSIKLMV